MTVRDRRIRVTGARRDQIDTRRIADLLVRVARASPDGTSASTNNRAAVGDTEQKESTDEPTDRA